MKRLKTIAAGVLLQGFVAAGCADDKSTSKSSAEELCDGVIAKFEQCNLSGTVPGICASNPSEMDSCNAQCAVEADCANMPTAAQSTSNPYSKCQVACAGIDPNAFFICAGGSVVMPSAAVCDGVPHCPDGSDEAQCGGTGDAGLGTD